MFSCLSCGAKFEYKSMLVHHCVLVGHQWAPQLPICYKTVRVRRHSRLPFVLIMLGLALFGAGCWLSDSPLWADAFHRVAATATAPAN